MLSIVDILANKVNMFGSVAFPVSDVCVSDTRQAVAVGVGECKFSYGWSTFFSARSANDPAVLC